MAKTSLNLGAIAGLALGAAGCAVGPNFHRPDPPSAAVLTPSPLPTQTVAAEGPAGGAQRFVQDMDIPGQWWTLYQSPAITALVAEALKANPDLQAAQAALRAARETDYAQAGALLPTLDAGYNVAPQKTSDALSSPLASNAENFTLHTAQLTVGYTPDVFGGLRRQRENTQALAQAQQFQTEAAYLTLTANLVAAAIQQASLAQQIADTRALIASDQKTLDLMRLEQRLGELARPDVSGQEAVLAQAEQTLPPLQKQLQLQNDLIADLTGHAPGEAPIATIDLAALSLPTEIPVSLPSKLVQQRPDIRAAEANLHAASAAVGVAVAARLPSFPLSANLGGASTSLASLFSQGDVFLTLSGTVTQPIFEGGALRHKQRAAEAQLDQAKAQYRSAVLTGLQNAADALQALDADARTLAAAVRAEHSTADSLASATQQYRAGEAASLAVLTAEQAHQQALLALTQAGAARLADTAALFQALGGGWWNRADVAPQLAQAAGDGLGGK